MRRWLVFFTRTRDGEQVDAISVEVEVPEAPIREMLQTLRFEAFKAASEKIA